MASPLLGDLRERPDGSFDGWCWAPDRPDERLIVDLLVDNTLAISMVAAIFRRDLQVGGHGDGRHGFVLRLPTTTPGLDRECLITARERRSGTVFGRLLRRPPVPALPHGAALEAMALHVQQAQAALDGVAAARGGQGTLIRWRDACGRLSARLLSRVAHGPTMELTLPDPGVPALTIAFWAADCAETLAAIDALLPALALVRADVLVVDPGLDPAVARLASYVRPLLYRAERAAVGQAGAALRTLQMARGAHMLWLGRPAAPPSAAALLSLAHALAQTSPALWLGVSDGRTRLPTARRRRHTLPSRLGLVLALDRALRETLADLADLAHADALHAADLADRAELLGLAVHEVIEPSAGPAVMAQARLRAPGAA